MSADDTGSPQLPSPATRSAGGMSPERHSLTRLANAAGLQDQDGSCPSGAHVIDPVIRVACFMTLERRVGVDHVYVRTRAYRLGNGLFRLSAHVIAHLIEPG
jgi:hypothetical protein